MTGEAGIGKSRLIAEFAVQCVELGVPVCTGAAWEAGGAPAYWPWTQVLRALCATAAGRAALRARAHLAQPLDPLVPEWVAPLPGELRLEPEQARFRMMDAVAGLVTATAGEAPLVVIVDPLLAAMAVDGIAKAFNPAVPMRETAVMFINHATRDGNESYDPKIDDTLVLDALIRRELLRRYPDIRARTSSVRGCVSASQTRTSWWAGRCARTGSAPGPCAARTWGVPGCTRPTSSYPVATTVTATGRPWTCCAPRARATSSSSSARSSSTAC